MQTTPILPNGPAELPGHESAATVLSLNGKQLLDQAVEQYSYDRAVIDQAVMLGDMKQMDKKTRLDFYRAVCLSVGLNPLTQPFTAMERQDKTVWLYANSTATQQLAKLHKVSFKGLHRIMETILGEPMCRVEVIAFTPDGREVPSQAVVSLTKKKRVQKGTWPNGDPKFQDALDEDGEPLLIPLRGESLANALMKADTKCLRRATLAITGLGWVQSDFEGRPVSLNMQTGELLDAVMQATERPPLRERTEEQGKSFVEHSADLFGDREVPSPAPQPLHPIWTRIEQWYGEAGREAQYDEFARWVCKRYRVRTLQEVAGDDLEELAAKVYSTLEPLILARRAEAQPEHEPMQEQPQAATTAAAWRTMLADILPGLDDATLVQEATSTLEDADATEADGDAMVTRVLNALEIQDQQQDIPL